MNRSHELWHEAQSKIPGGVNSPVRSFKYVGGFPIYFERSDGPYLFDVDGNRYVDFCLSFGPHLLGHGPKVLKEALSAQIEKGISFGANNPLEVEAASWILKAYPYLDKVRLLNSGTEAVMTAIRVARGFTGRSKILKFEGCYHGHSDGLLVKAGSGVAHLADSSSAGVNVSAIQDTLVANLDRPETWRDVFKKYGKEIAAVIVEPIPANHGLFLPSRELIQELTQLAHASGSLMIFDEVISGFRVGWHGAAGYFDIEPDLVTLGKIIGGGIPVGAVCGRKALMDVLAPVGPVYQAGTLSGNSLATRACVTMLSSIDSMKPYSDLEKMTTTFIEGLFPVLKRWGAKSHTEIASMFWFNWDEGQGFARPLSAESALAYSKFYAKALQVGVYFPPSPYEVGFISTSHSDSILAEVIGRLESIS